MFVVHHFLRSIPRYFVLVGQHKEYLGRCVVPHFLYATVSISDKALNYCAFFQHTHSIELLEVHNGHPSSICKFLYFGIVKTYHFIPNNFAIMPINIKNGTVHKTGNMIPSCCMLQIARHNVPTETSINKEMFLTALKRLCLCLTNRLALCRTQHIQFKSMHHTKHLCQFHTSCVAISRFSLVSIP